MKSYKKNPKKFLIILILAVSLITHFAYFGHPNESVFDEVHFGRFVSNYPDRTFYFDIHPPLGKLILVGFSEAFGYKPMLRYNVIGTKFSDSSYMFLRFLPTLAGSLLPLLIFLIALELDIGILPAAFGALMLSLENASIVQSRLILLDSFLLFFGFLSFWSYLVYKRTKDKKYFLLTAVMIGCSASIKWTGAAFVFLPIFYEVYAVLTANKLKIKRPTLIRVLSLITIPLIVYYLVFALHFALLNKSGRGDEFMSTKFQSTLIGNSNHSLVGIKGLNTFEKFIELNQKMYHYNTAPNYSHIYSSKWYTWPFMTRPIYYWDNLDSTEKIFLVGNPFVWYAGSFSVFAGIVAIIFKKIKLTLTLAILYVGYFANLVPFMKINRIMFLYHYLAALVFSIMILAYLIDKVDIKYKQKLMITMTVLAVVIFLFFSPLTYGTPISREQLVKRQWLSTWR